MDVDAARPGAPVHDSSQVPLADGRYAGGNHELSVELRVDRQGCSVISGDFYRLLPERHYVASFRTAPGAAWNDDTTSWPIVGQDEHGRAVQGSLSLQPQPQPAGSLTGQVRFDGLLEGLPSRQFIPLVAERQSAAFRTLGLEIEVEANVDRPRPFTFNGRPVTIEDALLAAGLETYTTGITDRIPSPPGGWEMAQLHALMSDMAQATLLRRAWEIHLLLLSRSDRNGLLGVMFDSSDALPRQGSAVFAEAIRDIPGIDHDRKLIQTTVHELGHALNLAHRFERVVGRADSTSFMNYDWRYRGGSRAGEYWARFQFAFDADEVEFLRHAPLALEVPGGAPFHSVAYWSEGTGGYSPYVPEAPLREWELTLTPPAGGPLLAFAQPVLMDLMLTNRSGRTISVPSFLLDPKAGFVEVLIQRVHAGAFAPGGSQALTFVPSMQRCFQWDAADAVALGDGQSMHDNINLTFGSGGFAFAEPGTYDVTALLVLFDEPSQREFVARSNTVRIRVALPKTADEEREAMDFFTADVGLYLTLGGSPALPKARETLQGMAERRGNDLNDPVVAHIVRATSIEASRGYVRYREGRFEVAAARTEEATRGFDALVQSGMPAFDAATRRSTEAVADRCRKAPGGLERADARVTPDRTAIGPAVLSPEETERAISAVPGAARPRPRPTPRRTPRRRSTRRRG